MELNELRNEIDSIDKELVNLFLKRTELSKEIGQAKKITGKAVNDPQREREIIYKLTSLADKDMENSIKFLYQTIFASSKSYQTNLNYSQGKIHDIVNYALNNTEKEFPTKATVACQGVEGAYSQIACCKLFSIPSILYFNSWDKVFTAVEKGLCKYGILPIENSTHGSVSAVYDLMKEHKFYIVKSIKLKIEHCLLAKTGTKLSDIREIFTHEQALAQCSKFIGKLNNVKITLCENTAMAAKVVADSSRTDIASISSKNCADLYNLAVIKEKIPNNSFNFTRFICISKDPEIYQGADKISIILRTEHKPGSLLQVLSNFSALGLNLTKIESRPVPASNFEFTFYFDFEASINKKGVLPLLEELNRNSQQFSFIGSYTEI